MPSPAKVWHHHVRHAVPGMTKASLTTLAWFDQAKPAMAWLDQAKLS